MQLKRDQSFTIIKEGILDLLDKVGDDLEEAKNQQIAKVMNQ